jgi:CDGSH-type Zn-finger protein
VPEPAREIVLTDDGPMLVAGPVEVVLPDGRRVRSDRPVSALCMCRRSRRQPFCDTSHRTKVRTGEAPDQEEDCAQPQHTASR